MWTALQHPIQAQLVSLPQPTMNSPGSTLRLFASPGRKVFKWNHLRLLVVAAIICSISYNYKLGDVALAQTQLLEELADRRIRSVSSSRRHPRRVSLVPLTGRKRIHFKMDATPLDAPIITQRWYDLNALDYIDDEECEPMYEWQLEGFPTCNAFHEINMKELRVINDGGSRIAFEFKVPLKGREKKFVFKTIKWNFAHRIDPELVDEQRKDSLVLMKTANDFIPPVWGYCSTAVLMDFMPEGSMHDYSE